MKRPIQKSLFEDYPIFKWTRYGGGYNVSSLGDKRFSALFAKLPEGRTIEQVYQCCIKGYDPKGTNWKLGKGKPPLDPTVDLWKEYLELWRVWCRYNPLLFKELRHLALASGMSLKDPFATTDINQARALATILNDTPD